MQLVGSPRSALEAWRLETPLPPWRRVRQDFAHHGLASPADAVRSEVARPEIRERLHPGMRVAIGCGSRGIGCLAEVVGALVAGLRAAGCEPFIVPAMGSHGGGTAEGQAELLAGYGVSESEVGAPVHSSMETVEIGRVLDGVHVFMDRTAFESADAIVPVARVKPHTSFRGEVESGLYKMLAIGFGKHRGASHLHSFSIDRFGELLPAAGSLILERMCVPFGIAIVEDSYEDAAIVEAVPGERFGSREPELLRLAREYLPRLPMDDVDVLLVQQIGKNISGTGMDPNVTGRFSNPSMASHVRVGRAVVLDLTPETHGNASGLGLADVATIRAAEKVDFHRTYTNLLTSQMLEGAKLPVIAPSDREAVVIAATTLWGVEPAHVRLAWIKNTLELGELRVSDPLWRELAGRPGLEALSDPEPMRYDETGTLLLD